MKALQQSDFALWGHVESINLGFKYKLMRSLYARKGYAVESYVEPYVESSVELRYTRRFEYVKVVLLSRYCTGLWASFRDDRVVMQLTVISVPTLPTFPSPLLLLPLALASSALSKVTLFLSYHK